MSFCSFANVYWCARDLNGGPVGNHHFILIVYANLNAAQYAANCFDLHFVSVQNALSTLYFCTLSSVEDYRGHTRLGINEAADIRAVKRWVDPHQRRHWYRSQYPMEQFELSPCRRNKVQERDKLDERSLVQRVANAALYFDVNPNEQYSLLDEGCGTWVNSLLRAVGYARSYRYGKFGFAGVDHTDSNLLPESVFRPVG